MKKSVNSLKFSVSFCSYLQNMPMNSKSRSHGHVWRVSASAARRASPKERFVRSRHGGEGAAHHNFGDGPIQNVEHSRGGALRLGKYPVYLLYFASHLRSQSDATQWADAHEGANRALLDQLSVAIHRRSSELGRRLRGSGCLLLEPPFDPQRSRPLMFQHAASDGEHRRFSPDLVMELLHHYLRNHQEVQGTLQGLSLTSREAFQRHVSDLVMKFEQDFKMVAQGSPRAP